MLWTVPGEFRQEDALDCSFIGNRHGIRQDGGIKRRRLSDRALFVDLSLSEHHRSLPAAPYRPFILQRMSPWTLMRGKFLSYRRSDSADEAARIHDHLETYFGRRVTFRVSMESRPQIARSGSSSSVLSGSRPVAVDIIPASPRDSICRSSKEADEAPARSQRFRTGERRTSPRGLADG